MQALLMIIAGLAASGALAAFLAAGRVGKKGEAPPAAPDAAETQDDFTLAMRRWTEMRGME